MQTSAVNIIFRCASTKGSPGWNIFLQKAKHHFLQHPNVSGLLAIWRFSSATQTWKVSGQYQTRLCAVVPPWNINHQGGQTNAKFPHFSHPSFPDSFSFFRFFFFSRILFHSYTHVSEKKKQLVFTALPVCFFKKQDFLRFSPVDVCTRDSYAIPVLWEISGTTCQNVFATHHIDFGKSSSLTTAILTFGLWSWKTVGGFKVTCEKKTHTWPTRKEKLCFLAEMATRTVSWTTETLWKRILWCLRKMLPDSDGHFQGNSPGRAMIQWPPQIQWPPRSSDHPPRNGFYFGGKPSLWFVTGSTYSLGNLSLILGTTATGKQIKQIFFHIKSDNIQGEYWQVGQTRSDMNFWVLKMSQK